MPFFFKNIINKVTILLGLLIFLIIFIDAFQKDYLTFLDFDLTVIYNSVQVISQENQTYRDHPAFSQFFFYGFFYKIYGIFDSGLQTNLEMLFNEKNIDQQFQKFYLISRFVNSIFCLLFLIYIRKVLLFFNINKFYILISLLFTATTLNATMLRADIIALSFFLISMFYLLEFTKDNKKYKLFIFSFCLIFSLLAKIQIIFFYSFLLIFIIFYLKYDEQIILNKKKSKFFLYKIIFFCLLFFLYTCSQFYLNLKPEISFKTYNFIDLAFYSFYFFLFTFLTFFLLKKRKNFSVVHILDLFLLIFFYSALTILFIFILSYINFIKFDYSLILSFTNPISFMMMSAPSSIITGENLIQSIYEIIRISFNGLSSEKIDSIKLPFENTLNINLFILHRRKGIVCNNYHKFYHDNTLV